jgi:hypothetical protein
MLKFRYASLILLFVSSAIFLTSCEEYMSSDVDDLDLVITNYQPSFNYSTIRTYTLPDKLLVVENNDFNGNVEYYEPTYGKVVIDRIKANFDAFGWQQVTVYDTPDVVLLASVSQSTEVHYYHSDEYWDWYYPTYYYPNGWEWYYGDYYSPPRAKSFKTGTVLLQMTVPDKTGASSQLPVVWVGVVNGLLEGSTTSVNNRISKAVDQIFTQSPYLRK